MMFILAMLVAAAAAYLVVALAKRRPLTRGTAAFDAPAEVQAAARQIGYRPKAASHPVDAIDDTALCVAAMATAFAQMDQTTENATHERVALALGKHLKLGTENAQAHATVGGWLAGQCDSPTSAFDRLTKRLKRLDHGPWFDRLMHVLGDVGRAKGMPSPQQADALGALARVFRTA
ncbi:hypothetical protein [Sulfitobacter sp. S190]|uniref:hypothetical protein n=1 Tax=Sulfitobacter sp. S190 TaxID=2867022 RepID=UPI0021A59E37|nr:hypothetical protein [Sulfitobacter sp. S190]UWR23645.1 hypothetical protein K3756_06665 [Sulfitobacter sp. S190]